MIETFNKQITMSATDKTVDPNLIDQFITRGLQEDVGEGDHTSLACIPPHQTSHAKLLFKDNGIIAGVSLAEAIFKKVDPNSKLDIQIQDGTSVEYGEVAFFVECNSQALLKAERLVLNSMQRMSGIASLANRFAFEVEDLPVKVIDTRKTTPLIRFLEKWAVRIGGCHNYRDGLYDWIMIKDNHIDACGGIPEAITRVKNYFKKNNLELGITVEVRNLMELHQVIDTGGITRIMLDNFELPLLREAVKIIDGRYETEASGGITINTVREVAKTGVQFISSGALTHSAQSMDISLKVIKETEG